MDVCPVGAITTRDYRFKSRPWDNPNVVDTMCTLCSKGCNTSAWLKAKPEWAKGSRLIRMTPRFNPDVNSYWMCDIGRFDYHWVEGETRLRQPMQRRATRSKPRRGMTSSRGCATHSRRPGRPTPGRSDSSCRRTRRPRNCSCSSSSSKDCSAADGLKSVSVAWTRNEKKQPAGTKFKVPATNAPNVNGARDLGYRVGAGNDGVAGSDGAAHRRRRRARQSAVRARSRVRTARSAMSPWIAAARQRRHASAARRAGCRA